MTTVKRNIKFLSTDDIHKIIAVCPQDNKGLRDRALMEVLFSTGLRISEALALRRSEVVASKGELTVIGKGGWQRVVFFSPAALLAISTYEKRRTDSEPLLFPLTSRGAQKMIARRAWQAGITVPVRPHMFRHSLATDLLQRGVDVRVVQEFLGHRSISSTQVYTHVASKTLKDIHSKLYGNERPQTRR